MIHFYNDMVQKLDEDISEISLELDDTILISETSIELIISKILELKQYILKRGFSNVEEEIHFFKVLKPNIVSRLIYFNAVYKIEAKMPYVSDKSVRKYLNREILKLKRFFDNNLEFYKYYRINSTYLDHKYFLRGKHDIKLNLDTYYFESDHNFSTSHDFKVAKIIANDLIQVYLESKLSTCKLNRTNKQSIYQPGRTNWTGSKTALIELIYALHSRSVLNNGAIDIKSIAKSFEIIFNIDLGNFYHTYLEIRNRKTNKTKFLDSLREGLIKKIEDADE